jgi:hypothetical protein
MVKGEIPEATAGAEVLFQIVQPLRMGWKFGSSAMVKELFFVHLHVISCLALLNPRPETSREKGFLRRAIVESEFCTKI